MTPDLSIVAVAAALLIGVLLGLLGGGGSILLVPVFVHLLGVDPKQAIAMSLPVVGVTSLGGAATHWRAGRVDVTAALRLGVLAMIGAFVGARLGVFVPAIAQMVLLALVMTLAGVSMLRASEPATHGRLGEPSRPTHVDGEQVPVQHGVARWPGVVAPFGIGVLTGLTGIGGGFLFVPALVLIRRLPFATAVGTSLLVIAANAAAGLAGYAGAVPLPWGFVAVFATMATLAAVMGAMLAPRVPQAHLRHAFGGLIVAVAAFVLFRTCVS